MATHSKNSSTQPFLKMLAQEMDSRDKLLVVVTEARTWDPR